MNPTIYITRHPHVINPFRSCNPFPPKFFNRSIERERHIEREREKEEKTHILLLTLIFRLLKRPQFLPNEALFSTVSFTSVHYHFWGTRYAQYHIMSISLMNLCTCSLWPLLFPFFFLFFCCWCCWVLIFPYYFAAIRLKKEFLSVKDHKIQVGFLSKISFCIIFNSMEIFLCWSK